MAEIAETAKMADLDPRVRRTRRMLQDALARLLTEKDFDKISIQDIAEASTLNRATFYDHYPDKFALLECMVAGQFRELIAKRGIAFTGCEGAITRLSIGICDYLTEMPGVGGQSSSARSLETAIVAVARGMILEGFSHHPPGSVPAELVASTAAWAIYGAAKEWVRMPERMPVDEVAGVIEEMVGPMFTVRQGS